MLQPQYWFSPDNELRGVSLAAIYTPPGRVRCVFSLLINPFLLYHSLSRKAGTESPHLYVTDPSALSSKSPVFPFQPVAKLPTIAIRQQPCRRSKVHPENGSYFEFH